MPKKPMNGNGRAQKPHMDQELVWSAFDLILAALGHVELVRDGAILFLMESSEARAITMGGLMEASLDDAVKNLDELYYWLKGLARDQALSDVEEFMDVPLRLRDREARPEPEGDDARAKLDGLKVASGAKLVF